MSTVVDEGNGRRGARGMSTINRPWSPRPCLLIPWVLTRISQAPSAQLALTSTNMLSTGGGGGVKAMMGTSRR